LRKKTLITIPIAVLFIGALALLLSTFLPLVANEPKINAEKQEKIGPKDPFEVEFSQWMNKDSVENSLKIFPEIEIDTEWKGNKLKITTKEEKKLGNHYSVLIEKGAKNKLGRELKEEKSIDYQIIDSPRVIHSYPSQIQDLNEGIFVTFTENMVDTVPNYPKKPIIIDPSVTGSWEWITPITLQFTPNEGWKSSTQYKVMVPRGTKSVRGIGTDEDYEFTVETKRIEVESIEDWHEKHNEPIAVQFNQSVEIRDLENFITIWEGKTRLENMDIEHAMNGDIIDRTRAMIIPSEGWKFNQSYTIEIRKGISAKNGNLETQEEIESTFLTKGKITITGIDEKNTLFGDEFKVIVRSNYEINTLDLKNNIETDPPLTLQAIYAKNEEGDPNKNKVILTSEDSSYDEIKFTINKDIRFGDGNRYLSQNLETTFTKANAIEVLEISPDRKKGYNTICAYTNNLLNKDSVFNNAQTNPHTEIMQTESGFVEKGLSCYKERFEGKAYVAITAKFLPITLYELTIGKDTKDIYEQELAEEKNGKIMTFAIPQEEKKITSLSDTYIEYENIDEVIIPIKSQNNKKLIIETCQIREDNLIKLEVINEIRNSPLPVSLCANYSIHRKDIESSYWEERDLNINISELLEEDPVRKITLLRFSSEGGNGITHALLPSKMRVIMKQAPHELLVWITNNSGEPIEGATIHGYTKEGKKVVEEKTDSDGLLYVDQTEMVTYLIATKDNQISFINAFWESKKMVIQEEIDNYLLVALDKEIYQKDDAIYFKVFLRKNDDASFSTPEQKFVNVSIRSPDETEVLKKIYLTNNGSFSDSLKITNPISGHYTLIACIGKFHSYCESGESYTRFIMESAEEEIKEAPRTEEETILESDRKSYEPGDTARFRFDSGEDAISLISVERKRIKHFEIRNIKKGKNAFTIEVDNSFAPNGFVAVSTIGAENQQIIQKEIKVETSNKNLIVETEIINNSDNDDQIELDINITDSEEKPVTADMIIALKAYSDEDSKLTQRVTENLYHRRELGIKTIWNNRNMTNVNEEENIEIDEISFTRPTAFPNSKTIDWITDIRSDESGRANVKIQTPEDGKKYEIFVLAIDNNARVGEDRIKVDARSDIVISNILPAYLRSGDSTRLQYTVENTTDKSIYLETTLESKHLNVVGKNEFATTVPALNSTEVIFEVIAPQTLHGIEDIITFTIKDSGIITKKKNTIAIIPEAKERYEKTSGSIERQKETILIENNISTDSKIKISAASTILANVADDIEYLLSYQYPTNDELAGRLAAIAEVISNTSVSSFENLGFPSLRNKEGEEIIFRDVVKNSLKKLSDLQNFDGGWSTWGSETQESDVTTTANILENLHSIKKAGFVISTTSYNNAFNFVTRALYNSDEENSELRSFLISKLSNVGRHETGFIEKIYSKADELSTNEKLFLANALQKAGFSSRAQEITHALLEDSFRSHQGLRLYKKSEEYGALNMNSVKRTALLLRIMLNLKLIENENDYLWILNVPDELLSVSDRLEIIKTVASYIPHQKDDKTTEGSIDINKHKKEPIYWDDESFHGVVKLTRTLSGLSSSNKHYINVMKKGGAVFYEIIQTFIPDTKELHATSNEIGIYRSIPEEVRQGEYVDTVFTIIIPKKITGVALEEYIPAGIKHEGTDANDTFDFVSIRNDHIYLYADELEEGIYTIKIWGIAKSIGKFQHPQARIYKIRDINKSGTTNHSTITITKN
jgi:hypothetical protein